MMKSLFHFCLQRGKHELEHQCNSSHSAGFCIYHLRDQLTSHFQWFVFVKQKPLRYEFQFKPESRLRFPQCFETLSSVLKNRVLWQWLRQTGNFKKTNIFNSSGRKKTLPAALLRLCMFCANRVSKYLHTKGYLNRLMHIKIHYSYISNAHFKSDSKPSPCTVSLQRIWL